MSLIWADPFLDQGMVTKKALYALQLVLTAGCASPQPENISTVTGEDPASKNFCSYSPKEETIDQRTERLGSNYGLYKEVIGGHNDIGRERINIIFTGVNYTPEEFLEIIHQTVDCGQSLGGMMAIEPFVSNMENFNFWYVPETRIIGNEPENVHLSHEEAREAAEVLNVPYKALLGILNQQNFTPHAGRSFFGKLQLYNMNLQNIGSYKSIYTYDECEQVEWKTCNLGDGDHELCSIIDELRGNQPTYLDYEICWLISVDKGVKFSEAFGTAGKVKINIHELGHSIAGFRDEYLDDEEMSGMTSVDKETYHNDLDKRPMNCFLAETKHDCLIETYWNKFTDNKSCYQGCGYTMDLLGTPVWRASENSIMNSGEQFDDWQIRQWCNVIQIVNQNPTGICNKILK